MRMVRSMMKKRTMDFRRGMGGWAIEMVVEVDRREHEFEREHSLR